MPFNPFAPYTEKDVFERTKRELASRPLIDMHECRRILGVGVYALYYYGDLPDYAPLVPGASHAAVPIYVGKAAPKNEGEEDKPYLRDRVRNHVNSINKAENIALQDFKLKWIDFEFESAVEAIEKVLIRYYRPIWNRVVTGFGNHLVGSNRDAQKKSRWDTLHPGRPGFSALTPNDLSTEEIRVLVLRHLAECGLAQMEEA